MNLKTKTILVGILFTLMTAYVTAFGQVGAIIKHSPKYLDEVIEIAAKVSGKPLSRTARKTALKQLKKGILLMLWE